jgi:hypothetical protein
MSSVFNVWGVSAKVTTAVAQQGLQKGLPVGGHFELEVLE